MKSKTAAVVLTAFTVSVLIGLMTCLRGQVILKETDINMDTVNKYFTVKTNAYTFDTRPKDSIALVLDTKDLEDWHKLISIRTNGVPVVEITSSGEVLYDTNNVSVATHIFWRELSFEIKRSLKR